MSLSCSRIVSRLHPFRRQGHADAVLHLSRCTIMAWHTTSILMCSTRGDAVGGGHAARARLLQGRRGVTATASSSAAWPTASSAETSTSAASAAFEYAAWLERCVHLPMLVFRCALRLTPLQRAERLSAVAANAERDGHSKQAWFLGTARPLPPPAAVFVVLTRMIQRCSVRSTEAPASTCTPPLAQYRASPPNTPSRAAMHRPPPPQRNREAREVAMPSPRACLQREDWV